LRFTAQPAAGFFVTPSRITSLVQVLFTISKQRCRRRLVSPFWEADLSQRTILPLPEMMPMFLLYPPWIHLFPIFCFAIFFSHPFFLCALGLGLYFPYSLRSALPPLCVSLSSLPHPASALTAAIAAYSCCFGRAQPTKQLFLFLFRCHLFFF